MAKTKKETTKVEKKETETKVPKYVVTLSLGEQSYVGEGDTAVEAVSNLQSPVKFLVKATLTLSRGELKSGLVLFPFQVKKLFANKLLKELYSKRLETMLT